MRAGAVVVLAALAGGAVAPATPLPAAEPLRMTIGVVGDIGSLDPREGTGAVAREIWRLQYPALTDLDVATLAPVPGLAASWTVSADRRQVTYTIRDGASWSDGRPVTAHDVVFSLRHARDGRWPYAAGTLDGLDARAADDRTVVVTAAGDPGPLPVLAVHVVPEHAFGREPGPGNVGAGDWHVTGRTDREVRLAAVDRPGRPPLDEIVYRSYPDGGALLGALRAGEVDVAAGLAPGDAAAARAVPGATVVHANDGDQWLLRAGIADRDLRRAVARSLDRARLVRDARDGVGRAQVVPVLARDHAWWPGAADAAAVTGDVGYRPSARAALAGRRLVIGLDRDDGAAAAVAGAVARQLREAGAEVVLAGAGDGPGVDLELVRRDPGDDPAPALAPYTCAAGRWCDAGIEAAYADLRDGDPARRRDAARAAAARLATEAVEIVLFAPDELQAFRSDHVTGLLREPRDERLVAFWPATAHYREVVRAAAPPGEEVPTGLFVVLAVTIGVIATAGAVVVSRRVRSRGLPVDRDVEGAVGGEGLAPERPPA
ncbi:MAG: hypothetical protein KatS3mg009_3272 [Acidimicrobiia bacterium]|nr:MAG: hypothetical protein KatS3mg009_3272 [Acidimicrobiia bacterium]